MFFPDAPQSARPAQRTIREVAAAADRSVASVITLIVRFAAPLWRIRAFFRSGPPLFTSYMPLTHTSLVFLLAANYRTAKDKDNTALGAP